MQRRSRELARQWLAVVVLVVLFPVMSTGAETLRVGPIYDDKAGKIEVVVEVAPGSAPLTQEPHLRLLEDGKPTLETSVVGPFEDSGRALALVICVDISGTMDNLMDEVKTGLYAFLAGMRSEDRVALMTFGDEVEIVPDAAGSPRSLHGDVKLLEIKDRQSDTLLFRALEKALNWMNEDGSLPLRRHVLVISDGWNDDPSRLATSDSVEKTADRVQIPIHAVAFGRIEAGFAESLGKLARSTGGTFVEAGVDRLGLKDALARVWADLMRNRSFVAYFEQERVMEAQTKKVGIELLRIEQPPLPSPSISARIYKTAMDGGNGNSDNELYIALGLLILALVVLGYLFRKQLWPPSSAVPDTPEPPEPIPVDTGGIEPPPPPPPPRSTEVVSRLPEPRSGKPAVVLECVSGPAKGLQHSLEQNEVRIGADSTKNDLCIEGDEYLSGEHALLNYDHGNLYLSDLNSSNGTFVNNERVGATPVVVEPGDLVRMGTSEFRLRQEPE